MDIIFIYFHFYNSEDHIINFAIFFLLLVFCDNFKNYITFIYLLF